MNSFFDSISSRQIIFCVLNWGIGHASRSMSLINQLILNDNQITIASSGEALDYLKEEFPTLNFIKLPDYKIHYAENRFNTILSILIQVPKLLFKIRKEHFMIEKLVNDNEFDLIISDSCFGAYSKKVDSFIISHQISIQSNFLNYILNLLNFLKLNKFNKVLVPDFSNHLLSGELSKIKYSFQNKLNIFFIGPLSRFNKENKYVKNNVHLFGIVSGPEPQKKFFFDSLIQKFNKNKKPSLITVGGKSYDLNLLNAPQISFKNNIQDQEFLNSVFSCKELHARSGYSTIMDFYYLGVLDKAIFYPTLGQTEQEYLALYHQKKSY